MAMANMEPKCTPDDTWKRMANIIQKKYYKSYKCDPWLYIRHGYSCILAEEIRFAFEGRGTEIIGVLCGTSPEEVSNFIDLIDGEIYGKQEFSYTVEVFNYKGFMLEVKNCPVLKVKSSKGHSFFLDVYGNVCYDTVSPSSHSTFLLKNCKRRTLMTELKTALFRKQKFLAGTFMIDANEEDSIAEMLCDAIYDNLGLMTNVAVTFSYVIGNVNGTYMHFPVINFRATTSENTTNRSNFFVLDHTGRFYKSWDLFEKENQYPACELCYPVNGLYECNGNGDLHLKFTLSPACKVSCQARGTLSKISAFVSLSAPIILSPVGAGITIGALGLYGIYDTCDRLADRVKHKTSISLKNGDGRRLWISLSQEFVSLGCGALGTLAKTGVKSERVGKCLNTLIHCTKGLRFVEVGNNIYTIANISREFCEKIFNEIKRTVIRLFHKVIEITSEIKVFFVKLWFQLFPNKIIIQKIAGGISSILNKSEKLAQSLGCDSKKEYTSLAKFVALYEANRLKSLQLSFKELKSKTREELGECFNETSFNKAFGIKDSSNRDTVLLDKVLKEMNNVNLESEYRSLLEKVRELNKEGDLRFINDICAVNVYFQCTVGNDSVEPSEFFEIIQRVATDDALIVWKETIDDKICVFYYDENVPVIIEIWELDEYRFVKDCIFPDQPHN